MTSEPENPPSNSEIAAAYDLWSATYDTDANRTRELAGDVLRSTGLDFSGRAVVEIGCGTGRNTEWLIQRAQEIVALDFSDGMLREARARVSSPRVRFVRHDIRATWPLADDSADLVLAMLVLEHVERLDSIFVEAARVLRPGGDLLICELHPMRQMLGRQAEFTHPATGEKECITGFLHDVSEYVCSGLATGFRLVRLDEHRDAAARRADPPRVLSLHLRLE